MIITGECSKMCILDNGYSLTVKTENNKQYIVSVDEHLYMEIISKHSLEIIGCILEIEATSFIANKLKLISKVSTEKQLKNKKYNQIKADKKKILKRASARMLSKEKK